MSEYLIKSGILSHSLQRNTRPSERQTNHVHLRHDIWPSFGHRSGNLAIALTALDPGQVQQCFASAPLRCSRVQCHRHERIELGEVSRPRPRERSQRGPMHKVESAIAAAYAKRASEDEATQAQMLVVLRAKLSSATLPKAVQESTRGYLGVGHGPQIDGQASSSSCTSCKNWHHHHHHHEDDDNEDDGGDGFLCLGRGRRLSGASAACDHGRQPASEPADNWTS